MLNHNSGKINELGDKVNHMLEIMEKRKAPNVGESSIYHQQHHQWLTQQ